jgi:hypothetical protein
MSNRRNATRYELWFPLELQAESSIRTVAISHDMSEKGLLVATPHAMAVGAEVRVTFKLPGPVAIEHVLEGVIVRVEQPEAATRDLWRYRVAIEFDERIPGLETVLRVLADDEED